MNLIHLFFLVHHQHSFSPGEICGFPSHPHRGFETVTYILEGAIKHEDSKGNKGTYTNNDVQWMTAGSGILHSEIFVSKEKEISKFNGFQLWVNLSANNKMCEPVYQMLYSKDIPQVELIDNSTSNGKIKIKIIAGEVNGVKSSIKKDTALSYLHIKMEQKNSKWTFPIPSNHNALIYILNGYGIIGNQINSKEIQKQQYTLLENNGDQFQIINQQNEELEFLLFEGKPFNEPFAHQGPFVMNTKEQLNQAFKDFYAGKFGILD